MTRPKSLVTVSVDNAFRAFPIDSERYELTRCLAEIVENISDDVPYPYAAPTTDDPRVKAFLDGTQENAVLGAIAYWAYSTAGEDLCSSVTCDRARRFSACLRGRDAEPNMDLSGRGNVRQWVSYFWTYFYWAMEAADDYQPSVPSDMELQS